MVAPMRALRLPTVTVLVQQHFSLHLQHTQPRTSVSQTTGTQSVSREELPRQREPIVRAGAHRLSVRVQFLRGALLVRPFIRSQNEDRKLLIPRQFWLFNTNIEGIRDRSYNFITLSGLLV